MLSDNVDKLVALLTDAKTEATKFFVKENVAAGSRLRKLMQEVKGLAQSVRTEVTHYKEVLSEKRTNKKDSSK